MADSKGANFEATLKDLTARAARLDTMLNATRLDAQ
jgi:hypothetical protein